MVSVNKFGKNNGQDVYLLTISNGTMEAEFISFGATLRSLRVPDKNSNLTDVCLGYDSVEEYLSNDGYIGAAIGRHANRIAHSRFLLNGKEYILSANEGENQLHGGLEGFSHKLWSFACGENSVTFSLNSPDGDEGYPGNLHTEITYGLDGSTLSIDYRALSDADTVVNLTNHAYFNLSGHKSGRIDSHILTVNADHYTPCGPGTIPTGGIAKVEGTALDMRSPTILGARLMLPELDATKGFDHNFALNSGHAARLYCSETGIAMDVFTSLEGMQIYSAGFLTRRKGKNGAIYSQHNALCLETQHFPDAINHRNFPSPILKTGEEYHEFTRFCFKVE